MKNIPGYTIGKVESIGSMPLREDVEIIPLTALQKAIIDLKYYQWMIADKLVPAIHEKNQRDIAQWDKEYEEGKKEHDEWCKKEWAAGRGTHAVEYHYWKPHPVPHSSDLGWIVGGMNIVNALGTKKLKLYEDKDV